MIPFLPYINSFIAFYFILCYIGSFFILHWFLCVFFLAFIDPFLFLFVVLFESFFCPTSIPLLFLLLLPCIDSFFWGSYVDSFAFLLFTWSVPLLLYFRSFIILVFLVFGLSSIIALVSVPHQFLYCCTQRGSPGWTTRWFSTQTGLIRSHQGKTRRE